MHTQIPIYLQSFLDLFSASLLVTFGQSVKIYKKGNGQTFIMIIRHHRYLCFYEKISSASTSIAPPPFSTAHFRRVCRLIFHEFINSKYNNQQPPHIYAMVSGGFLL